MVNGRAVGISWERILATRRSAARMSVANLLRRPHEQGAKVDEAALLASFRKLAASAVSHSIPRMDAHSQNLAPV